ncbi:MAG: hypothetical protein ACFFKA_04755, partial [Candidatus Thorarchaeota archaeon]
PIVRFNMKMKGLLSKAMFIDDKTIAKKLKQPLIKVQNKMFRLSNNQAKKSWLILYINKQYYYCNKQPIETFKKYHKEGLGEKDILEKLKNYGISMRAEIKAIEETLQKYDRLSEREISVKEYRDKQRFK